MSKQGEGFPGVGISVSTRYVPREEISSEISMRVVPREYELISRPGIQMRLYSGAVFLL